MAARKKRCLTLSAIPAIQDNFICPYCAMVSKRKHNVMRHIETFHPEYKESYPSTEAHVVNNGSNNNNINVNDNENIENEFSVCSDGFAKVGDIGLKDDKVHDNINEGS